MVCFPGCHGGAGREEGKKEGECGEDLGRKEEDMSVGESTKSTVHVAAEFLLLEYYVLLQSMCRYMYNTCIYRSESEPSTYRWMCSSAVNG